MKLHCMQKQRNGDQIRVPFKLANRHDLVLEKYCDDRYGFLRLHLTADTLGSKFYSLIPTDQAAGHAEKIDDFELDLRKHQIV